MAIQSPIDTAESDSNLILRAQSGDTNAFSFLVRRYEAMVFSAIGTVLPQGDLQAEDIAQETFITAWLHLSALRDPEKFAPWVYGIAKRKTLHIVSRRTYHENLDTYTESLPDDTGTQPDLIFLQKEEIETIHHELARLSDTLRLPTQYFYLEGLSIKEIAGKLHIPVGSVKRRLHDARCALKGTFSMIEQTTNTTSSTFAETVEKAVEQLRLYYCIHGKNEAYTEKFYETEQTLMKLPQADERTSALLQFYDNVPLAAEHDGMPAMIKNDCPGAALAKDALDQFFESDDNHSHQLELLDRALADPSILMCSDTPFPVALYFWRGTTHLRLRNFAKARADYESAIRNSNISHIYNTNARAALRAMDLMERYADDPVNGMNVMAEGYLQKEGKLWFWNEPGFDTHAIFWQKHRMDAINYYISRFNGRLFFDTTMTPGITYTSRDASNTLLVHGFDSTIITPAGKFERCMWLSFTEKNNYTAEIYYAENIGLIKVQFSGEWVGGQDRIETYELAEYEIRGGKGYYPLYAGNRWKYTLKELPDYLFQHYEYLVDWTNGTQANLEVLNLTAMKKDYLTNPSCHLDAAYYLSKAEICCNAWNIKEAICHLQAAVRVNTTEEDTFLALYGIEYLNRLHTAQEKNWRFCPSSWGINFWQFRADGQRCERVSSGNSYGPYRFGTRGEENRIFGVKPWRYLTQLMGCLWDDAWKAGTSGSYENKDAEIVTSVHYHVSDGGRIETPAGTFEHTLCLTIEAKAEHTTPDYYFQNNYSCMHCGTKQYWFARGVGLVRHDCTWGECLSASCVLVNYDCPAADDSYFPVCIGNRWEYDEVHLTAENYRAKHCIQVRAGHNGRFLLTSSQEFWYQGTEAEYEEYKKSLIK